MGDVAEVMRHGKQNCSTFATNAYKQFRCLGSTAGVGVSVNGGVCNVKCWTILGCACAIAWMAVAQKTILRCSTSSYLSFISDAYCESPSKYLPAIAIVPPPSPVFSTFESVRMSQSCSRNTQPGIEKPTMASLLCNCPVTDHPFQTASTTKHRFSPISSLP